MEYMAAKIQTSSANCNVVITEKRQLAFQLNICYFSSETHQKLISSPHLPMLLSTKVWNETLQNYVPKRATRDANYPISLNTLDAISQKLKEILEKFYNHYKALSMLHTWYENLEHQINGVRWIR